MSTNKSGRISEMDRLFNKVNKTLAPGKYCLLAKREPDGNTWMTVAAGKESFFLGQVKHRNSWRNMKRVGWVRWFPRDAGPKEKEARKLGLHKKVTQLRGSSRILSREWIFIMMLSDNEEVQRIKDSIT